ALVDLLLQHAEHFVLGHAELEAGELLGERLLVLARDHRRRSLLRGRRLLGLLLRDGGLLLGRSVRHRAGHTEADEGGKQECRAEPTHTSSDVGEPQKIHHMKNENRVLFPASVCSRVSSLLPSSMRPPTGLPSLPGLPWMRSYSARRRRW